MLAEQHAMFHVKQVEEHLEHEVDIERLTGKKLQHPDTEFHARSLIDSLTTLGQFDEARKYVGLVSVEYGEALERADAACKTDDGERCTCPNPTTERIDGGVVMGVDEHPRYLIERPAIFNPYAERLDTMYRCHLCGHVNAINEHPDNVTAEFHTNLKVA